MQSPGTYLANHTLLVEWNLGGLYTDCGLKTCFHVEIKDDPTFCDNVAIGQLQSDAKHESNSESNGESDNGNHIILKNIPHTEVTQGERFVNVKNPIEHLLNFPTVVHGHDGVVLGCDILAEIIVQTNDETDTAAVAVWWYYCRGRGHFRCKQNLFRFGACSCRNCCFTCGPLVMNIKVEGGAGWGIQC